ncbi:hypothetical protein GCK32_012246, partial [Trichostrongylus colubriformis]
MDEQMSATEPNVQPDGQSRCSTSSKREAAEHRGLFSAKSRHPFVCRDATETRNRFHVLEVTECEECFNNESALISEADKINHSIDFPYDTVTSCSSPGATVEDTAVPETLTSPGARSSRDTGANTISPMSFMDSPSSISVPPKKYNSDQLLASDLPMTNLDTSGRPLSDPSPAPANSASRTLLPMKSHQSKRRRRRAAGNRGASHTAKRLRTLPVRSPSLRDTSQLPRKTPVGFTHYLADHHPWTRLVNPRPISVLKVQDPSQVITRSLFPHLTLQAGDSPTEIPFIELQHLEDTIAFRWRSQQVINSLMTDTDASKLKLAKICNAACSTLAAVYAAHDDRRSHRCIATVTTPSCFPLCLEITLCEMTSEAGWTAGRSAALSISEADSLIRVEVVDVVSVDPQKELNVVVRAFLWSHYSLKVAVDAYGHIVGSDRKVEICVRLGKSTAGADPVYELVSHSNMFDGLLPGSTGSRIIDIMFAKQTL